MDGDELLIRPARIDDLDQIVGLLHNDTLGGARESGLPEDRQAYRLAFDRLAGSPDSELLVATKDRKITGCLQLTIIPGLSYRGALRCLVEDVRVDAQFRRLGIGARLLREAETIAAARGCSLMELFVHASRSEAQRFYEQNGYAGAHRGFRKALAPPKA